MKPCPCKSGKPYQNCCQLVHQQHSAAQLPEQLMRARYCAHVLNLVDFVINTYHPTCHAQDDREAIAESVHSNWVNLEVVAREPGNNANEGFVTFKAYLEQDGEEFRLEERSRFVRENGLWYYIDGTFPDPEPQTDRQNTTTSAKVGRNDPCPCGSGKKFKKCCG